jgi:hypothetical protein
MSLNTRINDLLAQGKRELGIWACFPEIKSA